jgi:hypothetical protein
MTYHKTKTDIVKLIIDQLKDDPDFAWKDKPHDKVVFEWFVTGRAGSGLRLTDAGKAVFENAKIAHYDFNIQPPKAANNMASWGKYTLILDKKVKCPYYIGVKLADNGKKQPYIRLYDHRVAMMMTLYGDLASYLESVN